MVYNKIMRIIVIGGVLLLGVGFSLVSIYRRGWDDATVQMRLAESTQIVDMVGTKEKINAEIVKKTVTERRKALSRYVVKGG